MIRFVVHPVSLDEKHPVWPNETVFHVKDLDTGLLSLACYTTYDRAEKVAKNKNLQNCS